MKVVKVRSPFIIEVSEAGAIGSKVELFIYPYVMVMIQSSEFLS